MLRPRYQRSSRTRTAPPRSLLPALLALLTAFSLLAASRVVLAADPGPSKNYMGINLSNNSDYDRISYADAVKQSRQFGTYGDALNTSVPLDANGWPADDFSIVVWAGLHQDVNGTYAISFVGQGTASVSVSGGFNYALSAPTYNGATNTTSYTLVLSGWTNPANGSVLFLSFSTGHHGTTNVKVMRPTSPGSSSAYAPGTVWTNQYINEVKLFQVARTMDYFATNGNTAVTDWATRAKPGDPSFSSPKGGSLENAILLANAANTDLWVNIPLHTDDDFVTKTAQTLLYGSDGVNPYTSPQGSPAYPPLNPGLKIYVEYSNEIWNYANGFSQTADNALLATQAVLTGTPDGRIINFDNLSTAPNDSGNGVLYNGHHYDNGYTWSHRRKGLRTVQISNLFRAVFGDATMPRNGDNSQNANSRVRPLLEWQYGAQPDGAEALDLIDRYFGNSGGSFVPTPHPASYFLWGGGSAAYYGPPDNNSDTLTVDQILSYSDLNSSPSQWNYNLKDLGLTTALGLKRAAYEGGLSLGDDPSHSLAAKQQALADSRLVNVVVGDQNYWDAQGGDLLMYFEASMDVGYGHTDAENDTNTPKLQGIAALDGATKPPVTTFGAALPATFDGAAFSVGSLGYETPGTGGASVRNDGGYGSRWLSYAIRAPSAGQYTVTVSHSTGGGGSYAVYVADILAGTATLTNGSDSFTVSLPAGLTAVRVAATPGTSSFTINTVSVGSGGGSPQASSPTFAPGAGTYTGAQSVTLSDGTPGAALYYTTDGSTPTTASTRYTGPLTVSSSETVKAVAAASGYTNSSVSSASYTINSGGGGSVVAQIDCGGGAVAGTNWVADTGASGGSGYSISGAIDTSGVTDPAPQAVYQSERYATSGSFGYAVGGLSAGAAYTVRLHFVTYYGGDTENVSLNGAAALTNFNIQQAAGGTNKAVVKSLTATADSSGKITLTFTQVANYAVIQGIEILGGSGGGSPQASSPTFSPGGGTYTTDGSTPTTSSAKYSGPVTVSSSETLKAVAVASGYTNSPVASATYTISSGTPVALVNPGYETGDLTGWLGGGQVYGVSRAAAHSGTYGAYNNGGYNSIFQNVTVKANTNYTLTVYARLASGSGTSQALYYSLGGAAHVDTAIAGSGWTQYTFTFNSGGSTSLQLGEEDRTGSSAVANMDDWTLTSH